jgi:hypothetical protein
VKTRLIQTAGCVLIYVTSYLHTVPRGKITPFYEDREEDIQARNPTFEMILHFLADTVSDGSPNSTELTLEYSNRLPPRVIRRYKEQYTTSAKPGEAM